MNFTKFSRFSRYFFTNFNRNSIYKTKEFKLMTVSPLTKFQNPLNSNFKNGAVPLLGFAFSFFKTQDEETPEDKLIMTLKRSIVCIQREQYDKAEQMLHLALRMAQDQQSKDGITYVYDVMANLAMQREQFIKAEKLFTDVMRRLLSDGHSEDSMQILHISSKIAHMAQMQGQLDKALQGFEWTLGKIEEKLRAMPDDVEVKELWGLTKNWFGELLMEQGNFREAKKCFQEALDVYTQFYGKMNTEAVTILNNLSVACTYLEDIPGAKKSLEEALELVKEFPDIAEAGVLKANLGLLYLKEGLLTQAKEVCAVAWKWGKQAKSDEAVRQAEYCLDEVNDLLRH